jgi:hypothetical protein
MLLGRRKIAGNTEIEGKILLKGHDFRPYPQMNNANPQGGRRLCALTG